jgi:hypothetical protein
MMVPAKLLSSTSTQQAGPKQTAVPTKIPEEPTTEEPINLRNLRLSGVLVGQGLVFSYSYSYSMKWYSYSKERIGI